MATSYEGRVSLPYRESFLRSLLWQDVRMDLVFDVLAHPEEMPSIPEFLYMEQFTDEAEVLHQLSMLVEYDILERVTRDEGDTNPDHPRTFYRLTPAGRACIAHFDEQFNDQIRGRLRDMYESVDHPNRIETCMAAPRPVPDDADTEDA